MGLHRTLSSPFGRSAFYSLLANGSIAAVAAFSVSVVPAVLGPVEYGYWQVFVFYSSYTLLIQMGLGDGAYLRYGGARAAEAKDFGVGSQMVWLLIFLAPATVALAVLSTTWVQDGNRSNVLVFTAVFALLANLGHFIAMILQALGAFKTFSGVVLVDRGLFLVLLCGLLITGVEKFEFLVLAEIVSKGVSLAYGVVVARDVLAISSAGLRSAARETFANVSVGLGLTLSNTTSMLILGVSRAIVDRQFGVASFGRLALALNVSSLFMLFVNAVGMVFLPFLRRIGQTEVVSLYWGLRLPLSGLMLIVLSASWPVRAYGPSWLPGFEDAFLAIVILLPVLVFETRMGLLIAPLMKTVRAEKELLRINVGVLILSGASAVIAGVVFVQFFLVVGGIALSLVVRGLLAEYCLLRRLKVGGVRREHIVELLLVICYYAIVYLVDGLLGFLAYLVLVAVALWVQRSVMASRWQTVGPILRNLR